MSAGNRKRKKKPHKCKNHPKVSAKGRCSSCGAWICSKCAYIRYGQFFCRDTCLPSLHKDNNNAGSRAAKEKSADDHILKTSLIRGNLKVIGLFSLLFFMLFSLLWTMKISREARKETESLKKEKSMLAGSIKERDRQIRELKKQLMSVSKSGKEKPAVFKKNRERRGAGILPSGGSLRGINGLPLNFSRGDIHKRQVSLTFDGGSFSNAADDILDTLKSRRVRAFFFFTGNFVKRNGALVRRIVSEGHDAGNHTSSHPHLTSWAKDRKNNTLPGIDRKKIRTELERVNIVFSETVGRDFDPLWRAPYGEKNNTICRWAQECGYIHIEWSRGRTWLRNLDTNDWAPDEDHPAYHSPEDVYDKVIGLADGSKQGINGGILLLHLGTLRKDPEKQVHRILGKLIDSLRQRGYRFVTVMQMLESSGVDITGLPGFSERKLDI